MYKAENESPLSSQLGDNSLLHNSPDFLPLTPCILLRSTKMNNYTTQTLSSSSFSMPYLMRIFLYQYIKSVFFEKYLMYKKYTYKITKQKFL